MTNYLKLIIKALLILLLIILIVRFFNLNYNTNPKLIGFNSDGLKECSLTPNCISSMTNQVEKQIDPIQYSEPFEYVRDRLTVVFHQLGATLISSDTNYLHYEFTTFPFAFTDDVEIYIDQEKQLIHLKSASRLGRYDFGTNRRRLDSFKAIYTQVE